ncbi:hypothetical protein B0H13DRAFT_2444280 [Mycena leptocephala]|nr:hypothetical protein B0H13DRAFT_2444280 [Mycena leptocephala]
MTNTDYVPSLPSLEVPHALFLRSDMRYGTDDPTLWPQQWTARYCHFPAIAKKGSRPELEVMWRDPTQSDFVAGSAVTRGLGRLRSSILGKLLIPINALVNRCKELRCTSPALITPLFGELINGILLWTEQLETLPSTYSKMVFAVVSLQRASWNSTPFAQCVGAFTTVPMVAHPLSAARLPFWFLRPSYVFDAENILAVVPLQEPSFYDERGEDGPPIVYSGNSTSEKIVAIHRTAVQTPWYRDPFEPPTLALLAIPSSHSSAESIHKQAHPVVRSNNSRLVSHRVRASIDGGDISYRLTDDRSTPITGKAPAKSPKEISCVQTRTESAADPAKIERDKFSTLAVAEMPPSIIAWAEALPQVDRSVPPSHLMLPTSAMCCPNPLVCELQPRRRRRFLHHWTLLSTASYLHVEPAGACTVAQWAGMERRVGGLMSKRGYPLQSVQAERQAGKSHTPGVASLQHLQP